MNRKLFAIVATFVIFSKVQCDDLRFDNASTCQDICTECGGEAFYLSGKCQCTVPEDLPAGQDCFVRKLRQAKFFDVDTVPCDSSSEKRTTRCVVASKFRKNDIEQVAKYFMNDGPIVGSIFRAPPFEPKTPRPEKKVDEPIECNNDNDETDSIVGNINMENLLKYTSVKSKSGRRPANSRPTTSQSQKTSLPTNPNFVGSSAPRTAAAVATSRCAKLPRRQQQSLLKLLIAELKRQFSSLPITLQNIAHTPSTEERTSTFFNSVSSSMDINDKHVECNCVGSNKPQVDPAVGAVHGTPVIRFMGFPVITMLAPPQIAPMEKPSVVEAPVPVKTDCPPVQDVTTEKSPITTMKEFEVEFSEVVTNPTLTTSEPDYKQELVVAPDLISKETDMTNEIEAISNFNIKEPNYSTNLGISSEAVQSPTITYLASMPASFLPSLIFNAPYAYPQQTNEQILNNFEQYENLNNIGQEVQTEFTFEIPYPKKICKKSSNSEYPKKFRRDVKTVTSTITDESDDAKYLLDSEHFHRKPDMISVPEIYRTTTQKPISEKSDIEIIKSETFDNTKRPLNKIKSSKELDELTKKPLSDKKLLASKRSINITK